MASWLSRLATGALLLTGAVASTVEHVVHEKRHDGPALNRGARVDADSIIPIRIGLKQSNLHLGYDKLMEVSDPASPTYGQHWSADEVHDLFAPADESVNTVKEWLLSSGLDESMVMHYDNKGWLAIDVPAEHAEKLLSTQYFEHDTPGGMRIGCDEYSLPSHVSPHVDFVKPGIKLSAPLKKHTLDIEKRGFRLPSHQFPRLPSLPPNIFPDYKPPPGIGSIPQELMSCGVNITPVCIQALYKIPLGFRDDPVNAMGLFEDYDTFAQEDISLFFKNFAPWVPANTKPKVISVDGGNAPVAPGDPRNGGESDIDIDLAQSLIYPQKVTVYQVDDLPNSSGEIPTQGGFLNTFLDSVDGSYCNYSAYGITGDSPGIDAMYPDTSGDAGAYTGPRQCGTYSLTKVLSISYGESEVTLPKPYVERQCNEIMKLGLQGHSILVASGDYGVASFPGSNGNEFGCLSGDGGKTYDVYNPDYPSGCPYITAVGATRLYPNETVFDPESAMQVNLTAFNIASGSGGESPPLDFFATGGGFSNYFTPPSYQAAAVSNYLAHNSPNVPSYVADSSASNIGANGGKYNRAGRGYPDVSANGAFLLIYNNLTELTFFGTSLASPIFGAVLTLINEERYAIGKGSVGFVNPTLYKNPQVLNDITNGSNPNCGSSGFKTAKGWDPVTGLGTPNYPAMLGLFLSLP